MIFNGVIKANAYTNDGNQTTMLTLIAGSSTNNNIAIFFPDIGQSKLVSVLSDKTRNILSTASVDFLLDTGKKF